MKNRVAYIRLGACEFQLKLKEDIHGRPIDFRSEQLTESFRDKDVDPWDVPYVFAEINVCHLHRCAATKSGKKAGPCNCGGDELMRRVVEMTEVIQK